MRELIEYVARELVEKPSAVKIREIKGAKATIYELSCAPDDMGRIIGKDGRIVKSLRILLKAIAAKNEGQNVELEIID
ncbi:MAG: KH domain-containing protein [Candidatus Hydrogenedentota bacterium]